MKPNIVALDELKRLQRYPDYIRNCCILAHVDHGKTTLADSLIASNGIISKRLAGTLRYMDSREDEQQRGITMKSSSITLKYCLKDVDHLINLIDSPGHVDFSSEVSTAVRLCDGAIIVVDVVEGICPQTHAVLRQIWQGKIVPILLLNKIDRLISELNLTPADAYQRLSKLLEEINCITAGLNQSEVLAAIEEEHNRTADANLEDEGISDDIVYDASAEEEDSDKSKIYFAPENNNVVFASAMDGWAFTIETFAEFFSTKLGFKVDVLKKTLWGNYYVNYKQKKIFNNAWRKGKKPLFVQLILDNIWSVYEAINGRNKEQINKICNSLGVKLSLRDTQYKDPRPALTSVMNQWLPISDSVLASICQVVPPPTNLPNDRILSLFTTDNKTFENWPEATKQLKECFAKCSSDIAEPVIVFVSKMVAYASKDLPENRKVPMSEEEMAQKREEVINRLNGVVDNEHVEDNTDLANINSDGSTSTKVMQNQDGDMDSANSTEFVAFARIFSGTLRKGQQVYVLGPKHDPSVASQQELQSCVEETDHSGGLETSGLGVHAMKVQIGNVYVLMGRELEMVDHVPAGNLLGISGLSKHIVKSATVSSTLLCPAFTALNESSMGIIRVAVNTPKSSDLNSLIRALKFLNQADANVQVLLQETGEHVLLTAGEVHLERCLKDLEEFAQVPIIASDPIVPYRETIIAPPKLDRTNELIISGKKTEIYAQVSETMFSLKVSAKPLPRSVYDLLLDSMEVMKILDRLHRQELELNDLIPEAKTQLEAFMEKFKLTMDSEGSFWCKQTDRIWAFGPSRVGANMLLNQCSNYDRPSMFDLALGKASFERLRECDSSIAHGFQLATASGPLAEEPMIGVAILVHDWNSHSGASSSAEHGHHVKEKEVNEEDLNLGEGHSGAGSSVSCFTAMSGKLISSSRESMRKAIQCQPCRLMEAVYKCDITVSSEKLGAVYAVLNRRRGLIIREDMTEDLTAYHIEASLPVEESFGFVGEMRLKTSGRAYPQLVFSHWKVIQEDPFWVPTTEEEKKLYGDVADTENFALKCVTKIRKRKGLSTHSKVVEFAEKQRTLSKKK